MENIIIVVILVCIIGAVVFYLYKAKKNGQVCIGCSCSKKCTSKKNISHGKCCCDDSDLNKTKE